MQRYPIYVLNELNELINKNSEHFRCPDCDAVVFKLTQDYILVMTDEEVNEVDANELPDGFDLNNLLSQACHACNPE